MSPSSIHSDSSKYSEPFLLLHLLCDISYYKQGQTFAHKSKFKNTQQQNENHFCSFLTNRKSENNSDHVHMLYFYFSWALSKLEFKSTCWPLNWDWQKGTHLCKWGFSIHTGCQDKNQDMNCQRQRLWWSTDQDTDSLFCSVPVAQYSQ